MREDINYLCVDCSVLDNSKRAPFGGWTTWFSLRVNYASVALFSIILMFLIPNGKGGRLLDWHSASNIQWGVLLLFAGGLAIAKAFEVTE